MVILLPRTNGRIEIKINRNKFYEIEMDHSHASGDGKFGGWLCGVPSGTGGGGEWQPKDRLLHVRDAPIGAGGEARSVSDLRDGAHAGLYQRAHNALI
jgi:hypothetical protein